MPQPAPDAFRRTSRWHHSCSCVVVDDDGNVRWAVDSIEERVATLEGRTLEQSMRIDDVREAVSRLEVRIGSLEERFDRRFEQLEQRLDQRFVAIDLRFGGIDNRLESMNKLLWGVLITTTGGAISVIAGIVASVFR